MAGIKATHSRPEARVFRVEDLLRHAQAGRIRVPDFQRAFKWDRDDVQKLIDSIWQGYPIGTLLLWSRRGPAGSMSLGDLTFEVSEQSDAWFVVDGQQRIVSLVSALLPKVRSEKFDLYFDLASGKITHARRGVVPPTFLPLNRVVDSEELLAWLDENRSMLTPELTRLALRVGKILREYEVPAYIVDVADERPVREIFERTNATGKSLEVSDIFNALHASLGRQPAISLKDVVDRLRVRSFGDIEQDLVLRSLLAIEGRDAKSGDLQRQLNDVDIPAAVARTETAMDRVFGFLSQDAGIPHLRLLPYSSPLTVLSAFFNRFPTPNERARRLLVRWLWRGTATEELRGDGKGMRPALLAVQSAGSADLAAREILETVSSSRPMPATEEQFNLRYARTRVLAIAMIGLNPKDLRTGVALDVAGMLAAGDIFPQIVTHRPTPTPPDRVAVFSSVGNRLLHPPATDVSLLALLQRPQALSVLASHGISDDAIRMLKSGDRAGFLGDRRDEIETRAAKLVENRAEWGHSDRTSIASLADQEV